MIEVAELRAAPDGIEVLSVDWAKTDWAGTGSYSRFYDGTKEIFELALTKELRDDAYSRVTLKRPNRPGIETWNLAKAVKLEIVGRRMVGMEHPFAIRQVGVAGVPHKIGFDPEVFMHDGSGKLLMAPAYMPDKRKPWHAIATPGHSDSEDTAGTVYADGVAAEITTTAGSCLGWQTDGVRDGLLSVRYLARLKQPKADFLATTLVELDDAQMNSMTDEQAALGCVPSFNAYGLKGDIPAGGRLLFQRVAGGHIHNEVPKMDLDAACKVTRVIDKICGVASVALFAGYENPQRRRYYGLPGEFRLPKHGYEYRVLSNCWMWHPTIMNVVVDLERAALRTAWCGLGNCWLADTDEVIETLLYLDVKRAQAILDRNKPMLVALLEMVYGANWSPKDEIALAAFNMIRESMGSKVKDPRAISANWRLDDTWMTHAHDSNLSWGKQSWKQLAI